MTKQRFITNYNYVLLERHMEYNEEASETVPDQALTIKQIKERYAQGIIPAIAKEPIYDNPETFNDFDETRRPDFDLSDVTEMKERYNELLSSTSGEKNSAPQGILKPKKGTSDAGTSDAKEAEK